MWHWIVGIGATFAAGYLAKKIPDWLAEEEKHYLEQIMKLGDAADQELILAVVKWIEAKVPEPDMGADKYDAVAARLHAFFPVLPQDKAEELIEQAVVKMKAAADEVAHERPADA